MDKTKERLQRQIDAINADRVRIINVLTDEFNVDVKTINDIIDKLKQITSLEVEAESLRESHKQLGEELKTKLIPSTVTVDTTNKDALELLEEALAKPTDVSTVVSRLETIKSSIGTRDAKLIGALEADIKRLKPSVTVPDERKHDDIVGIIASKWGEIDTLYNNGDETKLDDKIKLLEKKIEARKKELQKCRDRNENLQALIDRYEKFGTHVDAIFKLIRANGAELQGIDERFINSIEGLLFDGKRGVSQARQIWTAVKKLLSLNSDKLDENLNALDDMYARGNSKVQVKLITEISTQFKLILKNDPIVEEENEEGFDLKAILWVILMIVGSVLMIKSDPMPGVAFGGYLD